MTHAVLDLFCGTGFGVALQQMGAKEYGVDKMPEVHATRDMNGMETIYSDVWDIHLAEGLAFDTLIGGPPCPTFSAAGKGSGRRQMPLILEAIKDGTWRDIDELRAWADTLEDERTGLVLVPLAYIHRFSPDYILLEQVEAVLPIWQAYAEALEEMGYSTHAQVFCAEQYGVPQTRKRAILMARKAHLGSVAPPKPTHSKYYSRDPQRLDEGVLPWVSMADALSTVPANRPAPTVTGGGDDGRLGAIRSPRTPGDPQFTLVSNYSDGASGGRGMRQSSEPAFAITSKADRMKKVA